MRWLYSNISRKQTPNPTRHWTSGVAKQGHTGARTPATIGAVPHQCSSVAVNYVSAPIVPLSITNQAAKNP